MPDTPTGYDLVAYPAMVFPATHPDHLATIARLHGLATPPIETARVLEIGGGDGVNLIAMAAAYPDASFLSFDLSAMAVARGRALAAAAALSNVRIEVGDILDAATELTGSFDYIVAHGVYAWVPEPVRAAMMALIGRVLARDGVAFVSYNALPGGHMRRIIRDLLIHHVGGIADPELQLRQARAVLADFAAPRPGDRPVMQAVRDVARPMLRLRMETLYHDELGSVYQPQALGAVVAAADAAGLAFLNDALPPMLDDGFPGAGLDEDAVVHAAQANDFEAMAFFHQTLLIREGRGPARAVDPAALSQMFVAARCTRNGLTTFQFGEDSFEIGDARLADFIEMLAKDWPHRQSLAEFAPTPDECEAIYRLFTKEVVTLHMLPFPGARIPSERPVASALARAQIAIGQQALYTLDLRVLRMEAAGPRAFLALLDGSRDRAHLAADWAASPHSEEIDCDTALAELAAAGLVSR